MTFFQDKKSKVYQIFSVGRYISSKLKTITENMKIIFNNIFYSLTSSSSLGPFDFSSFLMTSKDEGTVRPWKMGEGTLKEVKDERSRQNLTTFFMKMKPLCSHPVFPNYLPGRAWELLVFKRVHLLTWEQVSSHRGSSVLLTTRVEPNGYLTDPNPNYVEILISWPT